MAYKYNMFHWEEGIDTDILEAFFDSLYLKLDTSNDPLTGELVITPSTGSVAVRANKDIVLKSSQKLIYDGA